MPSSCPFPCPPPLSRPYPWPCAGLTASPAGAAVAGSRWVTGLAAGGRPGLVTGLPAGGAAAPASCDDPGEAGDAVTGPGVDANPIMLASTMTTRTDTATQA